MTQENIKEKEQNEEKLTVATLLNIINSELQLDWIMIFANDEDDSPYVWIRKTGWNFEPVPYNKEIKDFWLEKDEDGIGVKIILDEDQ